MRTRKGFRFAVALYLIATLASAAFGQSGRVRGVSPATSKQQDPETLRLRVEEVLLPVSLRGADGKAAGPLSKDDFNVVEDGERQNVTAVLDSPANVLLVIDTSGEVNMLKNTGLFREVAQKIIASLGERDRAAIITYNEKINLIAPWTGDKEQLNHALNWKFRPGYGARFYESLIYAAQEVLPQAGGRRSIVLLTDGVDSFNASGFEDALRALNRARATVYIVSQAAMLVDRLKPQVFNKLAWYEMLDPNTRNRYQPLRRYVRDLEAAEITLRGLAEETGGAMWSPATEEMFRAADLRVIEEIGAEYVVAYTSERPPGDSKFHAISVYVNRPDIKARARRGVYSNLPEDPAKDHAPRPHD